MDIAIVFYSKSGVTADILDRLAKRLREAGHNVIWHRVDQPNRSLDAVRSAGGYVFATPVHAFSLPPEMEAHVLELRSIPKGATAFLLITQGLWTPRLGGNRCERQLRHAVERLGGHIQDTTVISNNSAKQTKTNAFLDRVSEAFS